MLPFDTEITADTQSEREWAHLVGWQSFVGYTAELGPLGARSIGIWL